MILSLWRNSEATLKTTLNLLEQAEISLKRNNIKVAYGFYENDSTDNTASLLLAWLKQRDGFFMSETLNAPRWGSIASSERTKWMAAYRNKCLANAKNYSSNYVIILDSDVTFADDLFFKMIQFMEDNQGCGLAACNTTMEGFYDENQTINEEAYYDTWALKDFSGMHGKSYCSNPFWHPDDVRKWNNHQPVESLSGFGSLAILRGELLKHEEVKWNGDKGCEHWHLCEQIRSLSFSILNVPAFQAKTKVEPSPVVNPKDRKSLIKIEHLINSVYVQPGKNKTETISAVIFHPENGNPKELEKCIKSLTQEEERINEIIVTTAFGQGKSNAVENIESVCRITNLSIAKSAKICKNQTILLISSSLEINRGLSLSLREYEQEHSWALLAIPQIRANSLRYWLDWMCYPATDKNTKQNLTVLPYHKKAAEMEYLLSPNALIVTKNLLTAASFPDQQDESLYVQSFHKWINQIRHLVTIDCLQHSSARYQSTTSNESFLREIDNVMLHGGLPGSEQSIQPSEGFIATQRTTPIPLLVPISLGELIDKVTILQIKTLYLHESALENVKKELDTLENIVTNLQPNIDPALIQRLKEVNQDLWHIEDDIRDHERQQNFGESFVRLARSVYQQNDLRSIIKKEINVTYGSVLVEEKSYLEY
jgi:hypothetical protein